jgi:hypothetical protein
MKTTGEADVCVAGGTRAAVGLPIRHPDVFDETEQRFTSLSLFPHDRELPVDAVDSVQVRLSGLELKRPRIFGSCWLACELWQQLGLDEFWQQRLPEGRETVSWEKVLRLLVVNRLLDPGSEFRVHRQWYLNSAMDELLEAGFEVRKRTGCIGVWITCLGTNRSYSFT